VKFMLKDYIENSLDVSDEAVKQPA